MANPENKQIPYESTQKDIRDAIERVATAIGGIAIPSADHVSYDNSVSGLSATDVQNALDEIVSDIPTVNDGTLTIQQNGETKGTFTANQSGNSTVNIETPTTDIQTAVDEFSTYNGGLLSSLKVSLTPNQDLHGYDHPWVGGAGKNKLPLILADIKSANTSGTWSGNEYTDKGVTFTINTDSAGNIISVNANGTASGNAILTVVNSVSLNENYIVSGSPSGGSYNSSYSIWAISQSPYNEAIDSGNGVTITSNYSREIRVRIANGYTANNLLFYPMIRLATESDPTFEPYTNECPISGHTQVDVDVSDGETTQEQITVNLGGTYYSGTLDVVSGVFVPDTASVDLGTLNWAKGSVTYYAGVSGIKIQTNQSQKMNALCSSYKISAQSEEEYNTISGLNWGANIAFWNLVDYSDANQVKTAMSGVQLVYELATPTPIQLSPTMVKALVGENHLSAPLEGQEITESKYKQMFTFDDVIAYIQSLS